MIGEKAWAARARGTKFGELTVDGELRVGDGGTFECQVEEAAAGGAWSVHRIATDDVSAVLAHRAGAQPTKFEEAGSIVIDSGVGALIPAMAASELEELGDDAEELATDTIDEALFGADRAEAIVTTPGGNTLAVFRLSGDGEYSVARGLDDAGNVCALVVLESES